MHNFLKITFFRIWNTGYGFLQNPALRRPTKAVRLFSSVGVAFNCWCHSMSKMIRPTYTYLIVFQRGGIEKLGRTSLLNNATGVTQSLYGCDHYRLSKWRELKTRSNFDYFPFWRGRRCEYIIVTSHERQRVAMIPQLGVLLWWDKQSYTYMSILFIKMAAKHRNIAVPVDILNRFCGSVLCLYFDRICPCINWNIPRGQ